MARKLSSNEQLQARIFGFTTREMRVFMAVKEIDTGVSVSTVAHKTKISRTTVGYMLRNMLQRGLIKRNGSGTRSLYQPLSAVEIEEVMVSLRQAWQLPSVGIVWQTVKSEVSVHSGGKALYLLWKEIASLPRYTRVRGIQPDKSFVLALEHIHDQVTYDEVVEINRSIGRRKIIMEAIVHERSVDSITEVLKIQGNSPVPFLDTFRQRSADSAKLPDDFLDLPVEMYIFNDVVIIMYWPEEYAVRIKNNAVADFLRGLFEATKYLSDRYNQNEKVAKKIVELATLSGEDDKS